MPKDLTPGEQALKDILTKDLEKLAVNIGYRCVDDYERLCGAADYIETTLTQAGYTVTRQAYDVAGKTCYNLAVEITGSQTPDEIIVIGAHYDTVFGCPGANDNTTGVAALLALARKFAGQNVNRTLRFVAFVNEEPPYFQTDLMGSLVYARQCRQNGDKIVAMLALETIGYYTEKPDSQQYPWPFSLIYPSTG
ncbi:MAG: M20/M25/M40 family metallo-hydrolase, partial [Sedimentisphaerales bacterium]|nr:M20/M25/M40 family metallo-hydrolase [Sedimentisphaerales bacterium]